MVGTSTRNARAISAADIPQSSRRISVTCVSAESASSQMANIIASWFSASASGESP